MNKLNENKILEDFKTNELDLRFAKPEKKEEIEEKVNTYKTIKNNFYKRFVNLLETNILDKYNNNEKDYLLNNLTNDFLIIFYFKNENEKNNKLNENNKEKINYKNIIEFLQYLLELQFKFEKDDGILNNDDNKFIYIILWFKCNSNYIYNIVKIFKNFDKYIPNLLNNIKDIVENKNVKIEISVQTQNIKNM